MKRSSRRFENGSSLSVFSIIREASTDEGRGNMTDILSGLKEKENSRHEVFSCLFFRSPRKRICNKYKGQKGEICTTRQKTQSRRET